MTAPDAERTDREDRIKGQLRELQADIRRNSADFSRLRERLAALLAQLDAEDRAAAVEGTGRFAFPGGVSTVRQVQP